MNEEIKVEETVVEPVVETVAPSEVIVEAPVEEVSPVVETI
jgi:hypothetical protein